MRIVASFLVTVSILGVCPCFGQWQGRKSVRVRSCPLADSLLGPMREGGSVQENYKVGADTTSPLVRHWGAGRLSLSCIVALPGPRTDKLSSPRPQFHCRPWARGTDFSCGKEP